ncbi:MAG: hypothetical protein HC837_04010 [Chloroflexaceae bacterium]|nr:hypothetical protein [Chloroflexaceae bacterium]
MRHVRCEEQTVEQVADHIAGANSVLRTHNIDPTTRLSLSNAAAATTNVTDEVMALLETQARRAARQR